MKFFLVLPPAPNDAIFTVKRQERKTNYHLLLPTADLTWGLRTILNDQISQHFADSWQVRGIRENTGKLFIIVVASLIWLIICWHQDQSITFSAAFPWEIYIWSKDYFLLASGRPLQAKYGDTAMTEIWISASRDSFDSPLCPRPDWVHILFM